jgi:hypothetical protein
MTAYLFPLKSTSMLGWAPTTMLVEQVLRRQRQWNMSTRKEDPTPWDEQTFQTILESVLGNRAEKRSDWGEEVTWFLGFLGLMELTDDSEWFQTRQLLDLATERRQRDKQLEDSVVK